MSELLFCLTVTDILARLGHRKPLVYDRKAYTPLMPFSQPEGFLSSLTMQRGSTEVGYPREGTKQTVCSD